MATKHGQEAIEARNISRAKFAARKKTIFAIIGIAIGVAVLSIYVF